MNISITGVAAEPSNANIPMNTKQQMKTENKVLIPLLAAPPSMVPLVSSASSSVAGSDCSSQNGGTPSQVGGPRFGRGSRSSSLPDDRLQRCRERNRIHARKTRLRKKEHMQTLQQRADELKGHQLRLKQIINEKNTASILLGFAASKADDNGDSSKDDPRVEELMRRPAEEIPDSTKIPELPALILPGQHASKKAKAESDALKLKSNEDPPNDGFDYELLGKDRAKCTPEELDQIRRERNRMHAKRTRDRKRLFMEEMGEICRQLEEENDLLRAHLKSIDPDFEDETATAGHSSDATDVTPIAPLVPSIVNQVSTKRKEISSKPSVAPSKRMKTSSGNHLQYLLEAARSFDKSAKADESTSSALLAVVKAINDASPEQQTSFSSATAVGC